MFGHGLDPETADLIAAKAVREALSSSRLSISTRSVETLVSNLAAAGALDREIALYVAMNPDRFILSGQPPSFDARWCLGRQQLAS